MKTKSKLLSKLFFAIVLASALQPSWAEKQCMPSENWFIPADNTIKTKTNFSATLPSKGIILLGEHHANESHHIWQLDIIKTLHKKQDNLIIGLEMLPRSSQQALDDWIAGKLSKDQFIEASGWLNYWSFNFEDYFPILGYARKNRIPLIALNVSHELLQGIKQVGWQAVPENHREGISDPAKPLEGYIRKLAKSFARHGKPGAPIDKMAFLHFLQQQLVWDRAMAEAIDKAKAKSENNLIIGLMGSWHIIDKEGVPHQLNSLGHPKVTTLVPWSEHLDCAAVNPAFADAIYGMQLQ